MRAIAFSLVIILFLINGCSRKRAAMYHFQHIIAYDQRLADASAFYNQKIERAITNRIINKNFTEPEKLRQKLVQKFDQYILELQRKHSVDGDTDLINSTIRYISGIRGLYEDEKKKIIEWRSRVLFFSNEQTNTISELELQIQNKSAAIAKDFIDAQKRFGQKFGFPIIIKEN